MLDPANPATGFNALDWIGRFGASREEDIVAVATWVTTDNPRQASVRDDFFRASAMQLLTALIADVCPSGQGTTPTWTITEHLQAWLTDPTAAARPSNPEQLSRAAQSPMSTRERTAASTLQLGPVTFLTGTARDFSNRD